MSNEFAPFKFLSAKFALYHYFWAFVLDVLPQLFSGEALILLGVALIAVVTIALVLLQIGRAHV